MSQKEVNNFAQAIETIYDAQCNAGKIHLESGENTS